MDEEKIKGTLRIIATYDHGNFKETNIAEIPVSKIWERIMEEKRSTGWVSSVSHTTAAEAEVSLVCHATTFKQDVQEALSQKV